MDDENQEKRDKIAYAINIREYLDLLATMQTNLQKIKERQSRPASWERKAINKSIAEFKALCDKLIVEHRKVRDELLAQYQAGKKEEIKDKEALLMAISAYYKGSDKEIAESIQKRMKEETELKEAFVRFDKKVKPSLLNFKEKIAYQKEYDALIKKQENLAERKKDDDRKYLELKKDMSRPEVSKQIYGIKDGILKDSREKTEKLNQLYKDYKDVQKDLKSLYEIKKTFEFEKGDAVIVIPEDKSTLKPVELLKSIASDLTKTQAQGLQVRINAYDNEI